MFFLAAQDLATIETFSLLPPAAIAVPLVGSLVVLGAERLAAKWRNVLAVLTALLTVVLVMLMLPQVLQTPLKYELPKIMQVGLLLRVDLFGFIFAALMSIIWFLATLHAVAYMAHEHAQARFFVFLLATLGSCLGVVLSGDLISLFLFFEMMTFFSYVLVIHEQTQEAMHAGGVMLYLSVAGGLVILMGIFLLYAGIGTAEIKPLYDFIAQSALNPYVLMALFIVGFGIKAGMIPLHIWLPKAHPVAPSPASALLSALMIKTGAYGIFRVVGMIFTPAQVPETISVLPSMEMGYLIIWIGIITMFLGAFMALLSTGAKKILAYSSVSQMGYILMGIGVAAYLGAEGAMGFAGALYHIINHAFFKAGFFLLVGSIYMVTHELDIRVLGGLRHKVPFLMVIFLIAYAGIGGIPGFNGYVSKTLLHHAIVEAATHGEAPLLMWAEKIFMLTSAMTLCYFAKLFRGLFLGRVPEKFAKLDYSFSWPVYTVLSIFGAIILAIGVFPHFLLQKIIIPSMQWFTYDSHLVEHLRELNVWNLHDLQGSAVVVIMAVILFTLLDRLGFFTLRLPKWLSVEYLFYLPAARFVQKTFAQACTAFDRALNCFYLQISAVARKLCLLFVRFDTALNTTYVGSGKLGKGFVKRSEQFDDALNQAYTISAAGARKLVAGTGKFDQSLNRVYETSAGGARKLAEQTEKFERSLNEVYVTSATKARSLAAGSEKLDKTLNQAYARSGQAAEKIVRRTADLDESLNTAYESSGRRTFTIWRRLQLWTGWRSVNFYFDIFLVAIVLVLFVMIIFAYHN
ncbi:MAG: NADH dehydrogenase subunit [Firmicutes bacterium]|nr:NADH dehydrogenase subunit [Bacillota bacterium]